MGTIDGEPVRKCEQLSPQEADAIFFPGRGGKPFRARSFCNGCPFERLCLTEAIELGLEGFYAGTTESERTVMARFHFIRSLMEFMPAEPDPNIRPIYLKVVITPDVHQWMDEVEPSEEELLQEETLELVG